ncbi:hypothetical protein D0C36_11605 [Mucilaginibacter conchicola]|uniref:Uncharacterized protein n=1 Tax=Mucilaginibacter conchicola TaxID=2303333 RepID=A0A372NSZ1_9SPHI|nr:hypothetical protein [Mucilaginibacter conchicola]RFZ92084.1 hypothetical protein D0C36_11605 [Mucilaginibacter conchicola]
MSFGLKDEYEVFTKSSFLSRANNIWQNASLPAKKYLLLFFNMIMFEVRFLIHPNTKRYR